MTAHLRKVTKIHRTDLDFFWQRVTYVLECGHQFSKLRNRPHARTTERPQHVAPQQCSTCARTPAPEAQPSAPDAPDRRRRPKPSAILAALDGTPRTVKDIAERADKPLGQTRGELYRFTIDGRALRVGPGRYVRTDLYAPQLLETAS